MLVPYFFGSDKASGPSLALRQATLDLPAVQHVAGKARRLHRSMRDLPLRCEIWGINVGRRDCVCIYTVYDCICMCA